MGQTLTKKLQKRMKRENKRDFTLSRNNVYFSTHERKTKTKKEALDRLYKKERNKYYE